jgi:serine/threonine protein kinase
MWAVGTIIAELITLEPLFPGSSEIDEIFRICLICGTPAPDGSDPNSSAAKDSHSPSVNSSKKLYDSNSMQYRPPKDRIMGGGVWQDGLRLAASMNFKFPNATAVPLCQIIENASEDELQLIGDMLMFDPHKRPSASETLRHPWFGELLRDTGSPDSITNGGLTGIPDEPLPKAETKTRPEPPIPIDDSYKLSKTRPEPKEFYVADCQEDYSLVSVLATKNPTKVAGHFKLFNDREDDAQSPPTKKSILLEPKENLLAKFHAIDPQKQNNNPKSTEKQYPYSMDRSSNENSNQGLDRSQKIGPTIRKTSTVRIIY